MSPLAEELPSLPDPANVRLVPDGGAYLPAHSSILEPCSQLLAQLLKEARKSENNNQRGMLTLRLPDTWPWQVVQLLKVAYTPTRTTQRSELLAALDQHALHGLAEVASACECQQILALADEALVKRCDADTLDAYNVVHTFV